MCGFSLHRFESVGAGELSQAARPPCSSGNLQGSLKGFSFFSFFFPGAAQ